MMVDLKPCRIKRLVGSDHRIILIKSSGLQIAYEEYGVALDPVLLMVQGWPCLFQDGRLR
jgi:hypothetical protein